jgi:N-acetylmuramoyl-L-alanine amidase
MNNTNIKKLVVACVATFALIGLQNDKVEAKTEIPAVLEDAHWDLVQAVKIPTDDIKLNDNNRQENWIYIEEMLQASDQPKLLPKEPAKPEIEAPKKELEEPAVSISNGEKDLLARLVEAEAKGESYEGKVAVATVVLNRVDSPEFPDKVTDVINEVVGKSYAFSPVQNGEIRKPASDEAKEAVDEALTREDRLNGSIYFYNPDIATDDWIRSRDEVKTIGNHVFAK